MTGGLEGIIGTSYGNNTLKTLHTFINYDRRSNYLQSSIIFFTIASMNYDIDKYSQCNLQKKINFVNSIKKMNILQIKIKTNFKIPFKLESIIFTEIIKNKLNVFKKASKIIFKNIKRTNHKMFGAESSDICCGIGDFQDCDRFKYY